MTTQDTFISHLVELRDRLLRAILAVVVVFLCLFPWARDLYAMLAKPLIAALPVGGQMIATDVQRRDQGLGEHRVEIPRPWKQAQEHHDHGEDRPQEPVAQFDQVGYESVLRGHLSNRARYLDRGLLRRRGRTLRPAGNLPRRAAG